MKKKIFHQFLIILNLKISNLKIELKKIFSNQLESHIIFTPTTHLLLSVGFYFYATLTLTLQLYPFDFIHLYTMMILLCWNLSRFEKVKPPRVLGMEKLDCAKHKQFIFMIATLCLSHFLLYSSFPLSRWAHIRIKILMNKLLHC